MRSPVFAILATLTFTASLARAQVVVSTGLASASPNDGEATLVNLAGPSTPIRLWTARAAYGVAADDAGRRLFAAHDSILSVWPYANLGLDILPTPLGVIRAASGVPLFVVSLAWDGTDLYAVNTRSVAGNREGIYRVDLDTLVATPVLLLDEREYSVGGLEYNSADGHFYALNSPLYPNSPPAGIYRTDLRGGPLDFVAPLPTGAERTDGLAAGGDTLYLVGASPSGGLGISLFNLATGVWQPPVPVGGVGFARTFRGGAYAPGLMASPPGANVGIKVEPISRCTASASAGIDFTYVVTVRNLGPAPADAVTAVLDLPDGAAFVSTTAGTHTAGIVTANLGSMPPGALASFSVVITPPGEGVLTAVAAVSTASPDPVSDNDVRASTIPIVGANARVLLSTLPGSPTSLVPDGSGKRFKSFNTPSVSPSGDRWMIGGVTTGPQSTSRVLVVGDANAASVGVRGGVTQYQPGATVATLDPYAYAINDAGVFVFSQFFPNLLLRGDSAAFEVLVRASLDQPVDAPADAGDAWFGGTVRAISIRPDGVAAFYAALNGPDVDFDTNTGIFSDDGATTRAREGFTIPSGQSAGRARSYSGFPGMSLAGVTNPSLGAGFSADGASFVASVTLGGSWIEPYDISAIVVDNAVVLEVDAPPPAGWTTALVESFQRPLMTPGGRWYVTGITDKIFTVLSRGFALRDGTPIAFGGEPITASSIESWLQYAPLIATGNDRDDLVGGSTDSPIDAADEVLVLNGSRVVAREGDSVDLNGNGLLDDNAYIGGFRQYSVVLTEDIRIYAVVSIRGVPPSCSPPASRIGDALIVITVPPPCPSPDFDGDGDPATAADIEAFFAVIAGHPCPTGACGSIDFDGDGDAGTDADIETFFETLAGGPC